MNRTRTLTRTRTVGATLALGAVLALAPTLVSCGDDLATGEWGTLRFVGRVKGPAPVQVLPPISDRSGNVYTLYGATGLPEVSAFVTRATGGSDEPCVLTKGDNFGAHGWSGFAEDRAWYWSGEWLVTVPAYGDCEPMMPQDPYTNAELLFRAVIPWVRVRPSASSLVALIQTPTDRVPFSAKIDLTRGIATNVAELPLEADAITVLGVGADPDTSSGVVLVSVTRGGGASMHALFYDEDANLSDDVPVQGEPPPTYGIAGYLQFDPSGLVVGLTTLGSLAVFDRGGGGLVPIPEGIEGVGVHRWDDKLWLAGVSGGKPVVAPLDDRGRPGPPVTWDASQAAAGALGTSAEIVDDRQFPTRMLDWASIKPGIGPAPFVSPHSPWPHAPNTTLWVVAGPEFPVNGRVMTSIAVAPVGIAYP